MAPKSLREIDRQRLKAVMQLNASTLQHYWWLGNDILKKQEAQGWGAKVIDMLSADLMKRYGNDSGYSIRNLKYMRQFAVAYPDFPFVQVPLAQLQNNLILKSRLLKFTVSADGEFVQVPLAQITWYHHISMFPKVKDSILRAFYITESALQGWSRDIMLMQIEQESQEETERNEEYSIFTYYLRPAFDFQQELFWNGEDIEVLEPLWLRKEIAGKIKRMWNKYKDDHK